MVEVRFVLIGTKEYRVAQRHIDWAQSARSAFIDFYEKGVGPGLHLNAQPLKIAQLELPNGIHTDPHPNGWDGTFWSDPFRGSHNGAVAVGYEPWETGVVTIYIWRGGGGYAGGWSTETVPNAAQNALKVGWAMVGDWWDKEGAYDLAGRGNRWQPMPASFGTMAHEGGHGMLIGPHEAAPNIMGPAVGFPNNTLLPYQIANLKRTGLFQTVPVPAPVPQPAPQPDATAEAVRAEAAAQPQPVPAPAEPTWDNAVVRAARFWNACQDRALANLPLTTEQQHTAQFLLGIPPASYEDWKGLEAA